MTTLDWYEGNLKPHKCEIKVVYSALNFQDVLFATGRIPLNMNKKHRLDQGHKIGIEYSGIDVKTGQRVMGITTKYGLASHIQTKSSLTWEIPTEWSLKEAATIPVAYALVYYAFFQTISIKKGKTILIHSGAGSVGMAAIRVALAYGLDVFTTVSNLRKKKFILDEFPQLKGTILQFLL